jgi:hypothetical protein
MHCSTVWGSDSPPQSAISALRSPSHPRVLHQSTTLRSLYAVQRDMVQTLRLWSLSIPFVQECRLRDECRRVPASVAKGSSTQPRFGTHIRSVCSSFPICSVMVLSPSVSFSDLEAFCGRLAARCYRLLAICLQIILSTFTWICKSVRWACMDTMTNIFGIFGAVYD